MVDLAARTRDLGFEAVKAENEFLKIVICLISDIFSKAIVYSTSEIDGGGSMECIDADYTAFEGILNNLILADNYSGAQLLERLLIAE